MAARIMLLEDDPAILSLVDEVLVEEGYATYLYAEALPDVVEVERVRPDLIKLDLYFGGQPVGLDLLRRLKANSATAHIPVIVCTASQEQVRAAATELAAFGVPVVEKPFDLDELLGVVAAVLAPR